MIDLNSNKVIPIKKLAGKANAIFVDKSEGKIIVHYH